VVELPSGTVTFLFSDIEGSTELLKRLGDKYGELMSEYCRLVREAAGAHDGAEIGTQGDAFFVAFARAGDAVAAAVEMQRAHADHAWPGGESVRLRIGVHTGEPTLGEGGYLGLDVVRAARLCAAGQGGQVLLSAAAGALASSSLPEGVSLQPAGERRLKDIDDPETIFALEIDGIEQPAVTAVPAEGEPDWSRRTEDLGARVAENINESVYRSLEEAFGELGKPPAGD
jgi:class 3 adenylate cyclase